MIRVRDTGLPDGLAMIFDMDGVIIDSNPIHRQAWRRYNLRFGIETDEAMLEFMYGKRNDEIVRHYFGPALSEGEVARHGTAKEALYREMLAGEAAAHLVPGVADFIREYASVPLAVASNAEPANVEFVLEASGLRPYFRAVVDGDQVQNPKPDPEIFLRAASLLGADPANIIVFEDSESGVMAGREAGARVVGIRTTHRELPLAHLTVDDFGSSELRKWLQQQKPVEG